VSAVWELEFADVLRGACVRQRMTAEAAQSVVARITALPIEEDRQPAPGAESLGLSPRFGLARGRRLGGQPARMSETESSSTRHGPVIRRGHPPPATPVRPLVVAPSRHRVGAFRPSGRRRLPPGRRTCFRSLPPPGARPIRTRRHVQRKDSTPMIIHSATVELHPTDVRLLTESGLALSPTGAPRGEVVPIGRADLASRLRTARAHTEDPDRRAVLASFLKQLRA
jgi:hypothetical protein